MTPQDVALVQASFARVFRSKLRLTEVFYARLFALDPSLRPLFRNDIADQRKKLEHMLAHIVRNLGRLDQLLPAARDLARRHAGYRVEPAHYATVGAALLEALEACLEGSFTETERAAWAAAYAALSGVMIEAAYAPAA